MAKWHISARGARSANVEALTDCELIEIPIGTLDRLLYRRPSWSKTLMLTLSKRLTQANEKIASSTKRNFASGTPMDNPMLLDRTDWFQTSSLQ